MRDAEAAKARDLPNQRQLVHLYPRNQPSPDGKSYAGPSNHQDMIATRHAFAGMLENFPHTVGRLTNDGKPRFKWDTDEKTRFQHFTF